MLRYDDGQLEQQEAHERHGLQCDERLSQKSTNWIREDAIDGFLGVDHDAVRGGPQNASGCLRGENSGE